MKWNGRKWKKRQHFHFEWVLNSIFNLFHNHSFEIILELNWQSFEPSRNFKHRIFWTIFLCHFFLYRLLYVWCIVCICMDFPCSSLLHKIWSERVAFRQAFHFFFCFNFVFKSNMKKCFVQTIAYKVNCLVLLVSDEDLIRLAMRQVIFFLFVWLFSPLSSFYTHFFFYISFGKLTGG